MLLWTAAGSGCHLLFEFKGQPGDRGTRSESGPVSTPDASHREATPTAERAVRDRSLLPGGDRPRDLPRPPDKGNNKWPDGQRPLDLKTILDSRKPDQLLKLDTGCIPCAAEGKQECCPCPFRICAAKGARCPEIPCQF